VHALIDVHDTPVRLVRLRAPARWIVQRRPFHRSMSTLVLVAPTAMHAPGAGQEMALSWPFATLPAGVAAAVEAGLVAPTVACAATVSAATAVHNTITAIFRQKCPCPRRIGGF
jgi:hypothetical protein